MHHTKMRQAMQIGCYIGDADGRVRIFWPQRSVELFAATADDALIEMQAAQNIIHHNPDYKLTVHNGLRVTVSNQTTECELAKPPSLPSTVWSIIESGEDQWIPMNGKPPEKHEDADHIKGVPKHGGVAYKEGVPASDCPYPETSIAFTRWNAQWDEAADKAAEPIPEGPGSVVTTRYRAKYAEMGHPTHCGDELAIFINNFCQNKAGTNLEIFEAICLANEVNLSRYNRTKKGWQGRLRMTGRNLLAKRVIKQGGILRMPDGMGEDKKMSVEWLLDAETKFKPKG